MNIEYFKAEFAKFLRPYVTPSNDTNFAPSVTPLTNQEILEAVNDVINSKLDDTLVDSILTDFTTPAAGIIVTTPDAPDIPKVDLEYSENGVMPGRFRSLDTLAFESLTDAKINQLILPEPGQLTRKVDCEIDDAKSDGPNAQLVQKKPISKSSPSMLVRSDTFVCDENDLETESTKVSFEKKIDPVTISGKVNLSSLDFNSSDILKKLKSLKDSATEVIMKIAEIEGNAVPSNKKSGAENSRPIRRLSAIGSFPGLNRTSTTARTIQRPKIGRRSISAFPGTPTSSRMSPGEATNDSDRRKSTSTLVNMRSSKLSIPLTYRSVSSGSLLPKKSPASSVASPAQSPRLSGAWGQKSPVIRGTTLSLMSERSDGRKPKNPKYAHVQSTLPKLGKRKAN